MNQNDPGSVVAGINPTTIHADWVYIAPSESAKLRNTWCHEMGHAADLMDAPGICRQWDNNINEGEKMKEDNCA